MSDQAGTGVARRRLNTPGLSLRDQSIHQVRERRRDDGHRHQPGDVEEDGLHLVPALDERLVTAADAHQHQQQDDR